MLDAYLDESGIHDGAAVCVIAGYFGGPGKWRKFAIDWRNILADFKVPMGEFHAKDLFPIAKGWFRHHWKGDHPAFLNAIADTIAKHPKITPVAAGVVIDDFNSFSLDHRRYFTGGTMRDGEIIASGCPSKPYFVLFQRCVIEICDYAPVGGRAHFFFGIDRTFHGYASKLFEEMANGPRRGRGYEWKERLGGMTSPFAKETPQLQAADFLAHLTYQHMLDAGNALGTVPASPLLAKCLSNKRRDEDLFFMTKENLQASLDMAARLFGPVTP